jgi:transcriptional regulator
MVKPAKSADSLQGTLELLILKTLNLGSNHGFGITLHIQKASDGLLRVEEGSLYPALHRLERNRLVTAEWQTTPNGRRARVYTLTADGLKRLSDAEESWLSLAAGVGKVLRFV